MVRFALDLVTYNRWRKYLLSLISELRAMADANFSTTKPIVALAPHFGKQLSAAVALNEYKRTLMFK